MDSRLESTTDAISGAETINLQEGNPNGVLLLHGFGDTPQTLRLLASALHAAGYDVRAPLLPGHGRTVEAFAASRRHDWLACARKELEQMRATHAQVAVAGLSMGGALAAILAAETREIAALVLLAPYLEMPVGYRLASASHWIWGGIAGTRKSRNRGSILDPAEQALNLGYGVYSGRLLYELWRLGASAKAKLGMIMTPTLVIQSRTDPRVRMEVAQRAIKLLGSSEKRLVWVEGAGHIITVDYGRDEVFSEVRAWLGAHMRPTD